MMQSSPLAIVTMRRDLSARYAATTRQWLAARNAYRRLHEQPVKNIIALREAAQRLDQLDRGRAALEELAPGCVAFFPLNMRRRHIC